MLAESLEPVVRSAVSASRASRDGWDEVASAPQRFDRARRAGCSIKWFRERVKTLAFRAAELMLMRMCGRKRRKAWRRPACETWRARSCRGRGGIGFSMAAGSGAIRFCYRFGGPVLIRLQLGAVGSAAGGS
jgi:hypothetical protein